MPEIKIVPIYNSENSSSSELILLEFQGKFETAGNSPLAGMEVGRLDLSGDKPVYFVGNQKLIGKEVKLTKPLAILKQQRAATEISAVSLIKKKILFDTRPITKMN